MNTHLTFCLVGIIAGDSTAWLPAKLDAHSIREDDRFGHSVALDGDFAAVGAIGDDIAGKDAGSIRIFEREENEWEELQRLSPEDAQAGDWFGYSSDLEGSTLVIGAPRNDDRGGNAGAVYVYGWEDGKWNERAKLFAEDAGVGARFGHSISLSEGRLAVGAWGDSSAGLRSGAVYLFVQDEGQWIQEAKLIASDARPLEDFGRSICLERDRLLVGKPGDATRGFSTGAAYVFQNTSDGWMEMAKLTSSDGAGSDHFGASVSINGEVLVIGAPARDELGESSGAAYVFGYLGSRWAELEKLVPRDGVPGAQFGSTVKIHGGRVVVGASNDSRAETGVGAAYEFGRRLGVWHQFRKLTASDGAQADGLGWSLDFDGETLLAGANHADDRGLNSGAVYSFDMGSHIVRRTTMRRMDSDSIQDSSPGASSRSSETH